MRNNKIVQQVVMTGELGYMIYKTPTVVDLTFDNKNKALEVADADGNNVLNFDEWG